MVYIKEDGDILGLLVGKEDREGRGPVWEVLVTKLGAVDRRELEFDEEVGTILSGDYFADARDFNLEGTGPG